VAIGVYQFHLRKPFFLMILPVTMEIFTIIYTCIHAPVPLSIGTVANSLYDLVWFSATSLKVTVEELISRQKFLLVIWLIQTCNMQVLYMNSM